MECSEETARGAGTRDRRSTGKSGVKGRRNGSTVQGEGARAEIGKHELKAQSSKKVKHNSARISRIKG